MSSSGSFQRPESIVRAVFATATVLFGVIGLLLRSERFLVAAGLCGIVWTLWDVLWDRLVEPMSAWGFRALTEGVGEAPANVRPTLDDTIRLLERHLAGDAARHVQIQAALRLEEIHRTIRKDPATARRVLDGAIERYPDATELLERRALAGEVEAR